ncbi:MAG: ribonuclease P protein component [Acetivibrionales bacterium]|jgi:ribonuclease P protein component
MSKLPVLTKNKEFQRVYSRGKYAASALLVIYVLQNNLSITRLGITTSKKVGNAVKRNRLRRLIRENARLLYDHLEKGFDVVIVARKFKDNATLDIVGRELRYLFHKLGLIDRETNV